MQFAMCLHTHSGVEIFLEAHPGLVNSQRMDSGYTALHAAAAVADNFGVLCLLASMVDSTVIIDQLFSRFV